MSGYGLAGHFLPAWLSSDSSSFVNCRAIRPTGVRVSPSAPLFECGVASAECGMPYDGHRVTPPGEFHTSHSEFRIQKAPVAQTIRAGGFEPPGCR